jgi:uncharacterized protein
MVLANCKTVVWRKITEDLSLECVRVGALGSGHGIVGRVIAVMSDTPLELNYRIETGPNWETRTVWLEQIFRGRQLRLNLTHRKGVWLLNGALSPEHAGCTDVDLGLSPSTNMLPINRLALAIGAAAEIRAAWIRFPSLEIAPTQQRYERRGQDRWRYTNLSSGVTADIEVDADGLPLKYENLWTRAATWQPARVVE